MSARLFLSTSVGLLAALTLAASAQLPSPHTAATQPAVTQPGSLQRGEALFLGNVELKGKPRDHRDFLPTPVVRCANCHGPVASGTKLKLDPALLLELRQRRGGPPSAYDQTKFCKVLRTGIDPAYIMIDHAMPIYDLPETDCAALFAYITRKDTPHESH